MAKTKCFFRFLNNEEKEYLRESHCLFTISVGQQTHEGEHFEATIDLINKSFKSCTMLVDDSLQRYTMALNKKEPPDYFYDISIQEGDLWLKRNEKIYEQLTNLENIFRWDTWLNHPEFEKQKSVIKKLINADENYAACFNKSISDFVCKYHKRINDCMDFDLGRAKKLSFDFIVEECTALCLWIDLKCNYEVYPNLHNEAINETRRRFILSKYPNLLKSITLGFRNAKQLDPQRFIFVE